MKHPSPHPVITAGDLRPALTALGRVVKKKAALPVLSFVKVEPMGRTQVRLTGTDGDTFFTVEVQADMPAQAKAFLVSLTGLQDRIKGARADDPVPLRTGKAPPLEEFPESPSFRGQAIELESRATSSLLKAMACASTDPTRHVLRGACLDVGGSNGHHLVGTDGRHLYAGNSVQFSKLEESVIVPALRVLDSALVRSHPDSWSLRIGPKKSGTETRSFRLERPDWQLTGQLVEGNFPNYRQVIPPEEKFQVRVTLPDSVLKPLAKAIRQLPGNRIHNRPVGVRIGKGSLALLAREEENSGYEELVVPLADQAGGEVTVFLNRDYLVKALSFGMNQIEIIDDSSPVRCRGESEFLIIMPIRQVGDLKVEHSRKFGGINGGKSRENPRRKSKSTHRVPNRRKTKQNNRDQPGKPPTKKGVSMPRNEAPTEEDPIDAAAAKIADVRDALRTAAAGLGEVTAALKATRQQQRQADREIRTVRKTLRTLRKVEL